MPSSLNQASTSFAMETLSSPGPMKWQWTHGPTLLLWRYHLHTAHGLFKNNYIMNFKIKLILERFFNKRRTVCRWDLHSNSVGPWVHCLGRDLNSRESCLPYFRSFWKPWLYWSTWTTWIPWRTWPSWLARIPWPTRSNWTSWITWWSWTTWT